MSAHAFLRLAAVAVSATFIVSCGGSDEAPPSIPASPPPASVPEQSPSAYLQGLPKWEQFSPPVASVPQTKVG